MSVRNWKVTVPFVLATLLPVSAFADDNYGATAASTDSATQDCIDKCMNDASAASSTSTSKSKSTKSTKSTKSKKASSGTVATTETPSTSSSSSTGSGALGSTSSSGSQLSDSSSSSSVSGSTSTQGLDQATIDSIRAEERARAAEEFNADQQATYQQHQAEIEKARAEGRAAAEAEANSQLSAERMRYESAIADEKSKDEVISNALVTPAGVYGFVGGGVSNMTQPEVTDGTGFGGYWDARVGLGTRSILGAEAQYVGSARDITALGVGNDAWLMSNGVEGIARLNVPLTPGEEGKFLIEPYTFGGVGWNRFNVVSDVSADADVTNEDDVLTVPMGVGLALGFTGVTLDLRGTYRHAVGSDLFGNETSSFGEAALNNWNAGAALGFEF